MKIVIVEDDEMLAEIYQTYMEMAEFECWRANNGVSGIQLIREKMPDVVLLDLMMPYMSGEEVLTTMRRSDWGKDIKVIILTNISEAEAPEGLEKLGFSSYLVKANTNHDEILAAVKAA